MKVNKSLRLISILVLMFIFATLVLILSGCSNVNRECYTNNCWTQKEYSTVKPVEVIYQRTTYKTRYVPQTTKEVTYEKRPYNCR